MNLEIRKAGNGKFEAGSQEARKEMDLNSKTRRLEGMIMGWRW
jgi:hypothetical protein